MALNLVNQVGEWNPQLFREIKGRLKPRNILITVTLSLLGQLLVLMSFASQLPVTENVKESQNLSHRYCTGSQQVNYSSPRCVIDALGGIEINWQLWWQDVFIWLSALGMIVLLVVGTYMLISDLSKEEQRGTLNFLRLTPQSSENILLGKLLGVPILLYLVGLLAFPLHLAAGLSGGISLPMILGVYALIGASCLFFYSVALLFGLTGNWLGGFQAWLGSGFVLAFMWLMTIIISDSNRFITQRPTDWLILFSPSVWLTYLTGTNSLNISFGYNYNGNGMTPLEVWGLPVGASAWSMLGVMLLNYGIWTYWARQGLKRCFHNPKATLFSKQQSYWLMTCFEVVLVGFALDPKITGVESYPKELFINCQMLLVFNLIVFLGFIAALSPHRQAMQDWARYRHQQGKNRKRSVMADLIWGEKSPALVAIALNVAISSSILGTWILFLPTSQYKIPALFALIANMSLILVYAAVAQLILLMKLQKRAASAVVTVGMLILVPFLMITFFSRSAEVAADLWLLSAFPWIGADKVSAMAVFLTVIGQSLTTALLSLQLTRQLRASGESSTKALLAGRKPVALN